jgi:hypothetical protein
MLEFPFIDKRASLHITNPDWLEYTTEDPDIWIFLQPTFENIKTLHTHVF